MWDTCGEQQKGWEVAGWRLLFAGCDCSLLVVAALCSAACCLMHGCGQARRTRATCGELGIACKGTHALPGMLLAVGAVLSWDVPCCWCCPFLGCSLLLVLSFLRVAEERHRHGCAVHW